MLSRLKSVELPGVLPFDGVSVERRTDTKFYGCGVDPRALLRDAVAELGSDHTEELKAFLLALVLGLRRREADMLEWQSFDFGAGTLRVMPTKWYQLKTNESAAVLPVEPEILELFRGWRAKARSGFVIESVREPKLVNYQWYRCEAVFAYLLGWLREKGVLRALYNFPTAQLMYMSATYDQVVNQFFAGLSRLATHRYFAGLAVVGERGTDDERRFSVWTVTIHWRGIDEIDSIIDRSAHGASP